MYQLRDLYDPAFNKKETPLTNIHVLHQKQDQTLNIEQRLSANRKKKRHQTVRMQQAANNKVVTALATKYMEKHGIELLPQRHL